MIQEVLNSLGKETASPPDQRVRKAREEGEGAAPLLLLLFKTSLEWKGGHMV